CTGRVRDRVGVRQGEFGVAAARGLPRHALDHGSETAETVGLGQQGESALATGRAGASWRRPGTQQSCEFLHIRPLWTATVAPEAPGCRSAARRRAASRKWHGDILQKWLQFPGRNRPGSAKALACVQSSRSKAFGAEPKSPS